MSFAEEQAAYWAECERLQGEVHSAMKTFYTYLEIHRAANPYSRVRKMMERHSLFWNVQLYSLQTTFFVVLFRIFDKGADAHSIWRLCQKTREHPEYFSRSALRTRKELQAGSGPTDWVEKYVAEAWEPAAEDLSVLGRCLRPHRQIFDDVYSPIRTLVFAHALAEGQKHSADLLSKANTTQIQNTLLALFEVSENLWQLFQNGRRFSRHVRSFVKERRRIRDAVGSGIRAAASRSR